jgi:hypothetical protein
MTIYELAGHAAFLLIALTFLVRDIVWLRGLSIISSLAGIAYNYFVPVTPLWMVIYWNVAFIAVNLYQIGLIFKERREVSFNEEEKELYETMFKQFSPVEFMKLMRIATWQNADVGKVLIVEQEPLADVMLIYNGCVAVESGGKTIARLKDGAFIGEMSFLSGKLPSATVTVSVPTRYVAWSKKSLTQLLGRNPGLRTSMQTIFTTDLTKKLMVHDNEPVTN